MTKGITMKGPIPTIAFMFSATASVRPRPRSSFSDGRGVDIDGQKRPKHIRCVGGAKARSNSAGAALFTVFVEGAGFSSKPTHLCTKKHGSESANGRNG